jgi:maltooligosyltrehalose trehalohydrolase
VSRSPRVFRAPPATLSLAFGHVAQIGFQHSVDASPYLSGTLLALAGAVQTMTGMSLFTPTFGAIAGAGGVTFRTWAPAQKGVGLVLDGGRELPMKRDPDGFFTTEVEGIGDGQRYWYRLDQGLRPDPASRYQPDGPTGPSQVVDPRAYVWRDAEWAGAPELHRNALYELHLGTFTREGTWRAAERHLHELAGLGITTLEVMPIAEYSGKFGWGYDGVDLYAPSHLYGTPDDARHFVDAAHQAGLAVVLDVVYNHFGPVGNFLRDFAPAFFGKPGDWGESINYDGADAGPVRRFMVENAAYWIAEYHFDGLRFDATHGIYDDSPEHVISDMCRAARAAAGGRRIFLVGETEPQDTTLLRASGRYQDGLDAIWNEDWHHAAFVALTGRREAYFSDYRGTAGEFASMARHNLLYQGQWYTWQKQLRGGFAFGMPSAHFVSFLENHDQVANTGLGWRLFQLVDRAKWRTLTALLLAGPHPPMLFQGQEFASSHPFVYFADHEGELGEAVRKGRIDFMAQFPGMATTEMREALDNPGDERAFAQCKLLRGDDARHNQWSLELHRDLLQLRRSDPVLSRLGTPEVVIESSSPADDLLLIRYLSAHGSRLLVVNLGPDLLCPMNDPLLAAQPGTTWALLWSSERPRYGGGGALPFPDEARWFIRGSSATILSADSR